MLLLWEGLHPLPGPIMMPKATGWTWTRQHRANDSSRITHALHKAPKLSTEWDPSPQPRPRNPEPFLSYPSVMKTFTDWFIPPLAHQLSRHWLLTYLLGRVLAFTYRRCSAGSSLRRGSLETRAPYMILWNLSRTAPRFIITYQLQPHSQLSNRCWGTGAIHLNLKASQESWDHTTGASGRNVHGERFTKKFRWVDLKEPTSKSFFLPAVHQANKNTS